MRSLYSTLVLIILPLIAWAQPDPDCATANGFAATPTSANMALTITVDPAWGDDGMYNPGTLTSWSVGYVKITPPSAGFWDFTISSPTSAVFDAAFGSCPFDGSEQSVQNASCTFFDGNPILIAIAHETGTGADVEVLFSSPSVVPNEDCNGAIAVADGDLVDNTCSTDGLVWFQYTVADGHDMDFTITDGTLVGASITQVLLGGCSGADITNAWDCLQPGDVVFIEAGFDTPSPMHGDFTINITDGGNGIANDECSGSTVLADLFCGSPVMGSGNPAACFDLEGACPPVDLAGAGGVPENASSGVWWTFTVDPAVPTFSFTGSDFEVFTGACNSLVSLGCAGAVALTNVDPDVTGTTYTVLVYDNGSFTATSDFSAPGNDLCAAAFGITNGSPLAGSLSCAGPDIAGTNCDEEAQVFYVYTTGTSKADINISIAGDMTNSNPATQASFLVLDGCGGTLYDDPNAEQCDVLGGATMDLSCVEPNTNLTIMVQSSIADAGDFTITVNENTTPASAPANDLCADAVDASSGSASGTTECANNEHVTCGGSPTDNDYQTVYYSYNVTSVTANLTIAVAGSGSTPLSAGSIAFYDDCTMDDLGDEYGDPTASFTGFTCDHTTDLELFCVPAGTYTIAVGSSLMGEGEFNLTITETNTEVMNDLCADAIDASSGSATGSTICANNEHATCGGSPTDNDYQTVYYSYDVTSASANLTIAVAGSGSSPLTAGSIAFYDDCTTDDLGDEYGAPNATFTGFTCDHTSGLDLYCVPMGTYTIAVGSSFAGQGEFNLTITETDAEVNNDECANAVNFNVSNGSLAFNTNNICANGEFAFCGLDGMTSHDIFWQITPTTPQDITINASAGAMTPSATDLRVAVLDACGGNEILPDGGGDGCNAMGMDLVYSCIDIPITIVVSSPDGSEGFLDLSVTTQDTNVPNDVCGTGNATPVATNGTANDNNSCASNDHDQCGGSNTDNDFRTLWFEYTTNATENVDLEITLSGAGSTPISDASVFVFEDDCSTVYDDPDAMNCAATLGSPFTLECIPANTTLFIAVGSNDAGKGEFDISFNETVSSPANDLCANEENLTANTATPGTTVCAGGPVTSTACDADKVQTVWYTYTETDPTVKEIIIDVTNFVPVSGADQISVAAFDDCNSLTFLNQADGSAADYCGASGTDLITIVCPEIGVPIDILVATSADNEGTFDITVRTTVADPNCVDNDLCADVDNTSFPNPIVTDDPEVCFMDCNTLACPDAEIDALCGGTVFNTVFYEITTDNFDPAIETFIQTNVTGLTSPVVMILEGSCGAYTLLSGTGCFAGDSGPVGGMMVLQPNTTYTIVVGTTDGMGGDFTLCAEVFTGCVNDECDNAVEITGLATGAGSTVTNPASTTSCTPDIACGSNDNNTVWYRFTMPLDATRYMIDINNISITGGTSIQTGLLTGCPTPTVDQLDCDNTTMLVECAFPGQEYFVIIGSNDGMDAGAFELTITPLAPAVPNDLCSTAEVLVVDDFCDWEEFASTTRDACPDPYTAGACDWSQSPVTFYEITTPADPLGNVSMEVTGALPNPAFSILTMCGDPPTVISGFECNTTLTENIPLQSATTYIIAVFSQDPGADGDFNLRIKIDVPPMNDDPDLTSDLPPVDLTGGGSHGGTTCCSKGADDMNNPDVGNEACGGAPEDAVWYVFTPDGVSQGVEIEVTPGTLTQGGYEVYLDGPTGLLLGQSCNASESLRVPCAEEINQIWVKVFSTEVGCGTFDITIMDIEPECDYADECVDAMPIALTTNLDGVVNLDECTKSCLDLACSEMSPTDCGIGNGPTVWFAYQIDDDAAQLYVGVDVDDGSWQPSIAMYGGDDCNSLTLLGNCNTVDVHSEGVGAQTVGGGGSGIVWVAVTAQDPSTIIGSGFTICAGATIKIVACVGGDSDFAPTCDPAATFDVIFRSNDPDGSLGLPLEGPFCPGEQIRVCWDFSYDATVTGMDWLHGIIPILGTGFDLVNFNPASVTHAGTGGVPQWFPQNTTRIQESIPNVCIHDDDGDGILNICNKFCQVCPCQSPMPQNTFLPGGWFWNSNGGAGCANNGIPETMFGIGNTVANISDFCFDLQIKDFPDEASCIGADYTVGFQTFSDGASGCWDDPQAECLNDVSQITNDLVTVACEFPPEVWPDVNPKEICSGGTVGIFVETENGDVLDIDIVVTDNPNVEGESVGGILFPGGSGTINDVLTVIPGVTTPQTVEYLARAIVPGQVCPGPDTLIEVIVYPEIDITFNPNPVTVCPGDCTTLQPIIVGGTGNYTMYEWTPANSLSDPTDPNPIACPFTQTTYTVIVTDDLGCTGSGEVVVEVSDPLELLIVPETYDVCQSIDGVNNGVDVTLEIVSGVSPFLITWVAPAGLEGNNAFPFVAWDGDTYHVDEELSLPSFGVPYELEVIVEDANGCIAETSCFVNVNDAPSADIIPQIPDCGETSINIDGTGTEAAGSGAVIVSTSIWTCDGIQIAENSGTTVTTSVNLLDYDPPCFYVLTEDSEGCTARTPDELIPITTAVPVQLNGDMELCAGSSGTVSVTNAGDYASFAWSPNSETTPSISIGNGVTNYVVTATASDGCQSVEQWTVTYTPNPDVQISGSTTFCPGTSTTLNGGGDPSSDTYAWEGPSSFTSAMQTISVNVAGEYRLTITDSNGCIGADTVNVSQEDELSPVISGGAMCDSSEVVLTTSGFETYQWFDPETNLVGSSDTIRVTIPGIYTVVVTAQGCSGSGTFEVINNQPPMVDVQDTVYVCAVTGEDQELDFNDYVTGAAGRWTKVEVTGPDIADVSMVDFEGLGLGTYTFVYTDTVAIAPCENQSDTMRVILLRPSASTFAPDPLCNDIDMLTLSTLENTPNAGSWSIVSQPGTVDISSGVFDATGQPAGAYVLEFTVDPIPGIDCRPSSKQTITVFEAPVINLTGASNQACETATGGNVTTFDLSTLIDPSSSPGTYAQTDGPAVSIVGTTIDALGLPQGTVLTFTYTTDPVAGSPCDPMSQEITVEVINCQCPPANLDALPSLCTDDTAIDLEDFLTSDRPGSWSTDALPNPLSGSVFDPSSLASGPYTVYYVFDLAIENCPDTLSELLIVRAAPQIVFNTFESPCNMDIGAGPTTVNLNDIVAGNGTSAGTWTQVDGTPSLTIEADGSVDFAGQMVGESYTFEYTTTSESTTSPCDNISDQITIVVSGCNCDNPDIEDIIACNNDGNVDLTTMLTPTTDAGSFTAFDPAMSPVTLNGTLIDVDGLIGGEYVIVHTLDEMQQGICAQADTAFLTVEESPTAVLLSSMDVCTVDTGNNSYIIDLSSFITTGDMSGVFIDDSGTVVADPNNVSFLNEPNGQTYNFQYVLPGTAVCDSVFFPIVVNTIDCDCPPIQPLMIDDVCGELFVYDLSPFSDPDQPGQWSSTTLTINSNVIDLTGVAGGTYEVLYTIDNPEPDCPDSRPMMVTIVDPFNAGVPNNPVMVCEGESILVPLRDLLDDEDDNGVWTETSTNPSSGTAFDPVAGTFSTDGQLAMTYRFTYTFAGNAPCPDVDATVEVTINPLPTAEAGNGGELTCDITTISVGGNSTAGSGIEYSWTIDRNGTPEEVSTSITYDAPEAGVYTLVVTDSNTGCSASDQVEVTIDDATPQLAVETKQISCAGQLDGSIVITVTGGAAPFTYSIDGGSTTSNSGEFTQLGSGTYDIVVSDSQGCVSRFQSVIETKQFVTVEASADIGIEKGLDTLITFTSNIPEGELANVVWTQDGEVVCEGVEECSIYNFTADYTSAQYCVEVTDVNGCTASDCMRVVTEVVRNVSIPNIFTPNDESGGNNYFYVKSSAIEVINLMQVYDRWGELVFEAEEIAPGVNTLGWDGKLNGKDVIPGVYVYLVKYTLQGDTEETIETGDVTVLR